ncbi:hypothetical protein GPECTOR_30g286 [Gonium pectorale]|uniref:Ankyrin repeat domain-containing protein n=1 Tax=Gonium pectorale TaxID=33097 RepID=A0A150GFT4_GONPE|nr:hypothetical protein GPECTOR_30g286 [Gonium pectorale]|eukprot:KXZ48190.1 hypothetical protein GPECTOR_30g286 [Gonium pectorale]
MAGETPPHSRVWLPELVERFARFLPPNVVACALRLVDKATSVQFRGRPQFATVRLSHPVPPWAFAARWAAPGAMTHLTLAQRHQLLCLTAASGVVTNLQLALRLAGCVQAPDHEAELLCAAANAGRLDACQWLLTHCAPGGDHNCTALFAAAWTGQLAICELLLHSSIRWTFGAVLGAARGGHLDLARWLLQQGFRDRFNTDSDGLMALLDSNARDQLLAAVLVGCELPAAQALSGELYGEQGGAAPSRLGPLALARCVIAAAGSSTVDWAAKVEWLESCEHWDFARDTVVSAAAAERPDAPHRLSLLLQRGFPVDNSSARAAAATGNAAAVELLLSAGVVPNGSVAAAAAEAGHVQVLSLLRSRGCQLNASAVAVAALRGRKLEALIWVGETLGFTGWTLDHMTAAAASGSVEAMAWLRGRGCPWGPPAVMAAAGGGCGAALEWLAERGCPMPADGSPYLAAAAAGDLATLRCLARLGGAGCSWGPAGKVFLECLEQHRPLAVLRCLEETGCPIVWPAVLRAASRQRGALPGEYRGWLAEQAEQRRQEQPSSTTSCM